MKAKEIIFEASLEALAKTPVAGGKTLGQAVYERMNELQPSPDLTEEKALEILATADPTPNNRYVKWIARTYLSPNSHIIFPEDAGKIADALAIFSKAVQSGAIPMEKRDINKIKSLRDLYEITDELSDEDLKSNREIKRDIKDEGLEKIIDDGDFIVYKIKSKDAACLVGKGTKWCTASDQSNNMFDSYNEKGDLYTLIVGSGDNQRKYQFHYEADQFMDEQDSPLTDSDIQLLSKYNGYKDFLNGQIKKHYAKYIEDTEE